MDRKRLLKDLPFGKLNTGTVLTKGNGGYYVENGDTIYKEGGSSHRGWNVLENNEVKIVDLIWDNTEWLEPATLKHLDIQVSTDKIVLSFKPLDLEQAQTFAKGLQNLLHHYGEEETTYTWHEYKGFTTRLY